MTLFTSLIFVTTVLLLLVASVRAFQLSRQNRGLRRTLDMTNQDAQSILRNSNYSRQASEHASDGIVIHDMKGRVMWANPAYLEIFGHDFDFIKGRSPLEWCLPAKDQLPQSKIDEFHYDLNRPEDWLLHKRLNVRANGEEFWNQMSVSLSKTPDGFENAVVVCRDVTQQVKTENDLRIISDQLHHEATHDGLTGVSNRAAFLAFMNETLEQPDAPPVGLLHIDLDDFKSVNDTHGHPAGDAVLVHAAHVLRDNVRKGDLVSRVGGDEFVVVCPDISSLQTLQALANQLAKAISQPFAWSFNTLNCSVSIGAALSENHDTTTEDLLAWSDIALYESKRTGRNRSTVYDKALRDRHKSEIKLSTDLIHVIDAGLLDYHFQPTMCLSTGQIMGFETLVRWSHPTKGLIPPDDFLPTVKDLGLMGALDLLSMTAALEQKSKLNDAGYENVTVAFNASPDLLSHPAFINRLIWGVEAGGIDRAQIIIEVIETTDFGDAAENTSYAAIVRDLRHAGFKVHLDDFGIGFAGLSHLAQLDVNGVKIDRSLVKNILQDDVCFKIVRKTVELGNELDLDVVAEGVEDQPTVAALRAMGCPIIQGYAFQNLSPQMNWKIGSHIT